MISLTELDPSPIDSPTPIDEKVELELVDEGAEYAGRATTAGPGLSSTHGAIFYCSSTCIQQPLIVASPKLMSL